MAPTMAEMLEVTDKVVAEWLDAKRAASWNEGRNEGRRELVAEVAMARGALSQDELQAFRDRLDTLTGDAIPHPLQFDALLRECPPAARKAAAWQALTNSK